ncbi:MAG: hypothetical protein NW226_05070 [Microscillaceae bacterium]|nr:hypothetical protein [Microscillaceae bacterium]
MTLVSPKLFYGLVLGFIFIGIQACYKKPDFDFAPKIEFDKVQVFPPSSDLIPQDSVVISIKFQDGNGDLGLTSEDRTVAPYQEFLIFEGDTTRNPFHFNYFVDVFKLQGENFVPVVFPNAELNFNGAFQPLFEDPEREGPLEGVLNYGLKITLGSTFKANDVLKFRIQIADRTLNLSNIIETDTLTVLRE